MGKSKFILYLIICTSLLSCELPNRKLATDSAQVTERRVIHLKTDSIIHGYHKYLSLNSNDYITRRAFFILHEKDSLLMIPAFAVSNLYGSSLETYHLLYFNYQIFEDQFLYSEKFLPQRLYFSYHVKLNKKILDDYNHMSFDDFKRKYWVINGNDTLLLVNDTTLAYCFDKHGYLCIFDYLNTVKIKSLEPE